MLAKFFHDISVDVGTSQFSVLCIIGFSCRPSGLSSRKVWTNLLTLVRLILRNLGDLGA